MDTFSQADAVGWWGERPGQRISVLPPLGLASQPTPGMGKDRQGENPVGLAEKK